MLQHHTANHLLANHLLANHRVVIRLLSVATLCALALISGACNSQEQAPESVPVNETADATTEEAPLVNQDARYLAFVDQIEAQLAEALVERAARDEFKRG